jgi:hypothetical protein
VIALRPALLTLALSLLAALALACSDDKDDRGSQTPATTTSMAATTSTSSSTTATGPTAVGESVPTAVANVCADNPSPNQADLKPADFGYRKLTAPTPGMVLRSPLVVSGDANPFEGAYAIELITVAGEKIAAMNYTKNNQQLSFSAQLPFVVSSRTQACVWVFERSGRDGSPVNITQVPVTLAP